MLSDNAHFLVLIIIFCKYNYIIGYDIVIIYATSYYYILDNNTYIIGYFFKERITPTAEHYIGRSWQCTHNGHIWKALTMNITLTFIHA